MAKYDAFADQYHELTTKRGVAETSVRYIIDQLEAQAAIAGKTICDIGCGQGELSSRLSAMGAIVTGVDESEGQLRYAMEKSAGVTWLRDDAMQLSKLPDASFDAVVSSLMLMDVPDHTAVFASAWRVLKAGGIMIWVVMHPCFQSPFSYPLEDGSRRVFQYAPQYWKSHGTGTIRSTLGAYHRPLSAYLNDFQAAGFSFIRMDEPGADAATQSVPPYFCVVGRKIEDIYGY